MAKADLELHPAPVHDFHRRWHRPILNLLPGLALTGGLAAAGFAVQAITRQPALSPLVVAMVLGILVRNTLNPPVATGPGIAFSLRRLLRLGIVLLGFRLTLGQLEQVGFTGLAVIALTLAATFIFVKAMGRILGVDRKLAELIAAGTSVCGASAVLAVNTVTRGHDEDVAYAIACVTIFGSLSMLIFPFLAAPLGLAPEGYGLWVGATVHEVAQVVGAAFSQGEVAGQFGTVAKLSRVMMLAPLILALGALARRQGGEGGGKAPMPWFVFGFIAVVVLNSFVSLPEAALGDVRMVSTVMLTMALAAMGLETHIGRLRLKGLRPLALGALGWLFISLFGLMAVQIV